MKRTTTLLLFLLALLPLQTTWAASSKFFWGYGENCTPAGSIGTATVTKGAIYIPAGIAKLYEGKTIDAIQIGLSGAGSNIKVFVTKDLDGEPLASQTKSSLYSGSNLVTLPSPCYTIDGEPFYVGYEVEGAGCMGLSAHYHSDGCWANLGDGWKNYALAENGSYNALAIRCRITGENLPRDLWLASLDGTVAGLGEECALSGVVHNLSPYKVTSYQLAYSIDGGEEQTADFKCTMLANSSKSFSLTLPGFNTTGRHKVNVRISLANGEADDYEGNNSATAEVAVSSLIPTKRMVCEEGTGTWCGYCPQGIVGFEYMYNKYPDNFIGIAVHSGDPMETESYSSLVFSSYPNCEVNRIAASLLPSSYNLEAKWNEMKDEIPAAEIKAEAAFDSENAKTFTAKVSTTFVVQKQSARYRLAFVVTENNVSGYQQANKYAGGSYSMGGFEKLGNPATVSMQHVAREIYGYRGIEGSIPVSFAVDVPLEYEKTFDTPSNTQNYRNLHLVVMLLDTTTGLVENAYETPIKTKGGATGITRLEDGGNVSVTVRNGTVYAPGFNGRLTIYNMSGRQVSNGTLTHGVYIVKGTDGSQNFTKRIAC